MACPLPNPAVKRKNLSLPAELKRHDCGVQASAETPPPANFEHLYVFPFGEALALSDKSWNVLGTDISPPSVWFCSGKHNYALLIPLSYRSLKLCCKAKAISDRTCPLSGSRGTRGGVWTSARDGHQPGTDQRGQEAQQ